MTDKAYTTVDLGIFGGLPLLLRFFYDLHAIHNSAGTTDIPGSTRPVGDLAPGILWPGPPSSGARDRWACLGPGAARLEPAGWVRPVPPGRRGTVPVAPLATQRDIPAGSTQGGRAYVSSAPPGTLGPVRCRPGFGAVRMASITIRTVRSVIACIRHLSRWFEVASPGLRATTPSFGRRQPLPADRRSARELVLSSPRLLADVLNKVADKLDSGHLPNTSANSLVLNAVVRIKTGRTATPDRQRAGCPVRVNFPNGRLPTWSAKGWCGVSWVPGVRVYFSDSTARVTARAAKPVDRPAFRSGG